MAKIKARHIDLDPTTLEDDAGVLRQVPGTDGSGGGGGGEITKVQHFVTDGISTVGGNQYVDLIDTPTDPSTVRVTVIGGSAQLNVQLTPGTDFDVITDGISIKRVSWAGLGMVTPLASIGMYFIVEYSVQVTNPDQALTVTTTAFTGNLSGATEVQGALNIIDNLAFRTATNTLTTTGSFNGILSPLNTTVQSALNTLDDHTHAASAITASGFSGLLVGQANVQAALNVLDTTQGNASAKSITSRFDDFNMGTLGYNPSGTGRWYAGGLPAHILPGASGSASLSAGSVTADAVGVLTLATSAILNADIRVRFGASDSINPLPLAPSYLVAGLVLDATVRIKRTVAGGSQRLCFGFFDAAGDAFGTDDYLGAWVYDTTVSSNWYYRVKRDNGLSTPDFNYDSTISSTDLAWHTLRIRADMDAETVTFYINGVQSGPTRSVAGFPFTNQALGLLLTTLSASAHTAEIDYVSFTMQNSLSR